MQAGPASGAGCGPSPTACCDCCEGDCPNPTITALSVHCGPVTGGTEVIITGTNFVDVVSVVFEGEQVPTVFVVDSDTQITVTTSPGDPDTVDVTITTLCGSVVAPNTWEWVVAPEITSTDVDCGPEAGGTVVVLTGTDFTGATSVTFDGVEAASFVVDSDVQITATTDAGPAGTGHITVTTCGGTGFALDGWTYAPLPVIDSLDVSTGSFLGGTVVVLTGSGFTDASSVTFNGVEADSFVVDNDGQITATTDPAPDGALGTGDVTVTTCGGVGTLTDGWTYNVIDEATWLVQTRNYDGTGNWEDEVGAVDAVPGAGANAPVWNPGNCSFDYVNTGGPDYHNATNNAALDPNGTFSVMVWAQSSDVTNIQHLFGNRDGTAPTRGWQIYLRPDIANDPVQINIVGATATVQDNAGTYSANISFTAGAVYNSVGPSTTSYFNGVGSGSPSAATPGAFNNAAACFLAAYGGASFGLTGFERAAAMFNGRALNAAQMAQLHVDLTNYPTITCDGDSLTSGLGLAAASSYPSQLRALIADTEYLFRNTGVPSQTLTQMEADAAAQIDATAPRKGVVVCWGGINDINEAGPPSAATVQTRLQTYCQARQAAGWQVIVLTLTPTVTTVGAEETNRLAVNTWIRANWATFADALADPANEANLQNVANATYFQGDQIHLTAAGYAIVAGLVDTALGTLGIT